MKVQLVRSSPLLANFASTFDHQQFINLSSSVGATNRSTSLGGSIITRTKEVGNADCSDNHNETAGAMMNVADDEESLTAERYCQAIDLIVRKCEALSADNEKLIQRLHQTKKITRRKERDVGLLKSRLDLYSDEWRTAQPESQFKGDIPSLIPATNNVVVRKKYKKREKPSAPEEQPPTASSLPNEFPQFPPEPMLGMETQQTLPDAKSTTKTKHTKPAKPKRPKSEREKDPNAPKRPANPFFQFCQERRSILMGELNSELMPGEPELSKQELTRQLANRWRALEPDAKQIYINMYEMSKRKYNAEMETYRGLKNAVKAVLKAASRTTAGSVSQ